MLSNLLVLYLVVEMTGEPVVEKGLLNVAGPSKLHGNPVPALVRVNVHGQVADLGHPCEPVALEESDEEVPAETGPETAQQRGKGEVKHQVKYPHGDKILN